MRHKYSTRGIVLNRHPLSEASVLVTVLTSDLGLIRARAQGLRKPGAKLASALQTLTLSEVIVVHGKEGWRASGALLEISWSGCLSISARIRAGRIGGLILRLVPGEGGERHLFAILDLFLRALHETTEDMHDAAECLAALQILNTLGLAEGEVPARYTEESLSQVRNNRREFIVRINQGLTASGL